MSKKIHFHQKYLGDMERSLDYLRNAYILEGDEIFYSDGYGKIDHNKYFEILKKMMNLEQIIFN